MTREIARRRFVRPTPESLREHKAALMGDRLNWPYATGDEYSPFNCACTRERQDALPDDAQIKNLKPGD